MKKIVLFDIDYTLFNAKTFREILWQDLGKQLSQPESTFQPIAEEVYVSLRGTISLFDPILFARVLAKRLNISINEKDVEKLVIDLSESGNFLYEEAKSTLEEIGKKENIEVGIFSTGFFHLQRAKISSIAHLIKEEHIYIFEDKKISLLDTIQKYKNEKLFLVDDFYQLLQEAKEINPQVVTIWVKRGRHAEKVDLNGNFMPDYVVESLHTVASIVDKH